MTTTLPTPASQPDLTLTAACFVDRHDDCPTARLAWMVSSDAGDGINGRIYIDCASADGIDDAKSAVAHHYGDGSWEEVPTASQHNAWEYFTGEDEDSVARIDPVVKTASGWVVGRDVEANCCDCSCHTVAGASTEAGK